MTSHTASSTDVDVVRGAFEALANGDIPAFAGAYSADATWHHRNDDRFGGVHRGRDAILAFVAEAGELTAGTLRPEPQALMADGEGRVAVLVRMSATRPDGRAFDNPQMLLFTVDEGRIRTVDQFVGDPRAVAAFWA